MANVLKIPNRVIKAGGKNWNFKVVPTSGYYSPPKDCIVRVHLVGGGGGGSGGGETLTQGTGGGGAYVMKTLRMKAGYAYNVTIGAGGTGGTAGFGGAGSNGGTTSVEGIDIDGIYAFGGGGGLASSPSNPFAHYPPRAGGAGGDVVQMGQGLSAGNTASAGASGFGGTRIQLPSTHPLINTLNNGNYTYFNDTFLLYNGAGGTSGQFVPVPNPWSPLQPGYYNQGSSGQPGVVIFEEIQ
jgi:hypothetical protein